MQSVFSYFICGLSDPGRKRRRGAGRRRAPRRMLAAALLFALLPAGGWAAPKTPDPMLVVEETPVLPAWLSPEDADRLWVQETPRPSLPKVIDRTNYPNLWADYSFPKGSKVLDIWIPDIRDADAAVLKYEDDIWMIDCGEERTGEKLQVMLKQLGIQRIDKLFNSHPHHDHLTGLKLVDDVAKVQELLVCFPEDSTEVMIAAMELAKERKIRVTHYADDDVYVMGDERVELTFWMKADESRSMNDQSAQTMLVYDECRMLFTADMERGGQRDLLAAVGAEALKADILKYPHHGKMTTDDAYLAAVDPELVVITNYYRAGESWYYLTVKHIDIAYTNKANVFLHLATDGERWICEYVPYG